MPMSKELIGTLTIVTLIVILSLVSMVHGLLKPDCTGSAKFQNPACITIN